MNLLITGGLVFDGTGAPPRRANVRVKDGRIAAVGASLKRTTGETVLDARGLAVAPGFIDTHSHADGGLLETPTADAVVRQGITTVVVGQDGGHRYPLADWFGNVEKTRVAPNVASFVGHGTVRGRVLGEDFRRKATDDEVRRMAALAAAEAKAGAVGLSSGLEYEPGLFSAEAEVAAVAKAVGSLYISHVRDEEDEALESFAEVTRIARAAGVAAQISHIKLGSAPVWGKAREVLKRMADARRAGLDVTADVYPYTFWQSGLATILPSPDARSVADWEKALAGIGGAENVRITGGAPDASWNGRTLAEIAKTAGKSAAQVASETPGLGVMVTAMREADLETFMRDPHVMFCTDGGLRGSHPRAAGSFPRILARYVRERRVLPLEMAIRKMTLLPASRMGFSDRGKIAPGMCADLTLFAPARVQDRATVATPGAPPSGIPHVLVNGAFVVRNEKVTGERPGRVLRRGAAAARR
jgi:N-acyl-D-aspartate/D-glutamate deacylase